MFSVQSSPQFGALQFEYVRNGTKGKVTCRYNTENDRAVNLLMPDGSTSELPDAPAACFSPVLLSLTGIIRYGYMQGWLEDLSKQIRGLPQDLRTGLRTNRFDHFQISQEASSVSFELPLSPLQPTDPPAPASKKRSIVDIPRGPEYLRCFTTIDPTTIEPSPPARPRWRQYLTALHQKIINKFPSSSKSD
jgi:hypothetical protein